jgi:hypothetical protein
LQAFLGLFNFYRRFVHRAAAIVKPLTDTLRGSLAPAAAVKWSAEMVQAFAAAKAALGDTALLEHPRCGITSAVARRRLETTRFFLSEAISNGGQVQHV